MPERSMSHLAGPRVTTETGAGRWGTARLRMHAEVVPAEHSTETCEVDRSHEAAKVLRTHDRLRPVEDRDADTGRIVPRTVQDPVRHIGVRPECARPDLRATMPSGEERRGRAEPGEARPSEVDKP